MFCSIVSVSYTHLKLWFHTNTVNKEIQYFSCSNHKTDTRGTCETRHYVRADAIEQVVMLELRRMAQFLEDDEKHLLNCLPKKQAKMSAKSRR